MAFSVLFMHSLTAQSYQKELSRLPQTSVSYLNGYQENSNYLIFYPKSQEELVSKFLVLANDISSDLELQLENKLPNGVRVYLYPNKETYESALKRIELLEPNAKRFLKEAVHWYYSDDLECELRTEYALSKQILFGSLYGKDWQDVILSSFQSEIPEWLEEAASHLIVYGFTPNDIELLEVHNGFASKHELADIYDGKAFLFFLLNEFGWENFMDFLYLCRLNQDFSESVFYIYNIPPDYLWEVAKKRIEQNLSFTRLEQIERDIANTQDAIYPPHFPEDSSLLLPFQDTIEAIGSKFFLVKDTLKASEFEEIYLEKKLPFHPKSIFNIEFVDTAFIFDVLSESGVTKIALETNYEDWWIQDSTGYKIWKEEQLGFSENYWLPFEYHVQITKHEAEIDSAVFITEYEPKPFRNTIEISPAENELTEYISINRFVVTNWASELNNKWIADQYMLQYGPASYILNPAADAEFKLFLNDYLGKYTMTLGSRISTSLNAFRLFGSLKQTSRKRQKELGGLLTYERFLSESGGVAFENRVRLIEFSANQYIPISEILSLQFGMAYRQSRLRPISTVSLSVPEASKQNYTFDGNASLYFEPEPTPIGFTRLHGNSTLAIRGGYAGLEDQSTGLHGFISIVNKIDWKLLRSVSFVHQNRFAQSFGDIQYLYILGGTRQQLFANYDNENSTDPRFNYGFYHFGGVNRGFLQNSRNGNSVVTFNTEIQLQLFQSTYYPKGLRSMEVGLLWDAGAAFNGINRIGLAGVREVNQGSVIVSVEEYQLPYIHSLGGFIRLPLFGYDFEISYAKGLQNGFWNENPSIFLRMGHAF